MAFLESVTGDHVQAGEITWKWQKKGIREGPKLTV